MSTKSQTIIIGHKNPDTDSVASVLVYANLKTKLGEQVEPAIAGPLNNETRFVLSYLKLEPPKLIDDLRERQVILLDHGEMSQALIGLDKAEIVEVIDHHKIGDIQTQTPILYRAEPVGSTCTIVAKLFKEKGVKIEKRDAGLLLAGIISDTLFLHSPTTTKEDKEFLQELAEIAEIKPEKFAQEMFEAKSDISSLTVKDIISGDYKEFEFAGVKFGVGVFETVKPAKIRILDAKIFHELETFKKEKNIKLFFFLLVDILEQSSFLYLAGEEEIELCQKGFSGKIEGKVMFLSDVVSRKKQIIPVLSRLLEHK